MKLILKYSIAVVLALMFVFNMSAQMPANPIRWKVNVRMTSADEGEVVVKATVDAGWHLYGTELPPNGPQPTSIDFSDSKGVRFVSGLSVSPAPKRYRDSMFEMDLTSWDTPVVFRRRFKVIDAPVALIAGKIKFMGCNDQNCMPPKVEVFSKKVTIKK